MGMLIPLEYIVILLKYRLNKSNYITLFTSNIYIYFV